MAKFNTLLVFAHGRGAGGGRQPGEGSVGVSASYSSGGDWEEASGYVLCLHEAEVAQSWVPGAAGTYDSLESR